MFKSSALNIMDNGLMELSANLYRRIKGVISCILAPGILTGDLKYVWHFIRYSKNELYNRHVSENYINCVFCSNLVRTGCHKHCLKCGIGTYIRCSPSLPGILYDESAQKADSEDLHIPWYFREPCSHFNRLPEKKYLRNMHSPLGQAGIYDFEALEGLENGISGDSKPCHVCAAVNYELYKRCLAMAGFDTEAPCNRADAELRSFYMNKAANKKVS